MDTDRKIFSEGQIERGLEDIWGQRDQHTYIHLYKNCLTFLALIDTLTANRARIIGQLVCCSRIQNIVNGGCLNVNILFRFGVSL